MIRFSRFVLAAAFALMLVTPVLAQNDIKLKGAHYNLNLLGKKNCPGDDLKGTNRHTIMVLLDYHDDTGDNILGDTPGDIVDLDKHNKIFLAPGEDFQVTDGNACDRDGAALTLPDDIATEWDIYVRELAKPGGAGSTITTCGISDSGTDDPSDDEVVCSSQSVELERKAGRPKWRNVTKELTTIDYMIVTGYDLNGDPIYVEDTASLFDSDFYQYLWDYDNLGLRLVQLRFYEKQQ